MELALERMSYENIKIKYPNEWILLGNPKMKDPLLQTSLNQKLESGIVLLHGIDRFEIAQKSKLARVGYTTVTLFYTGFIPKNRKLWL
jgi:hypothetical protein